MIFLLAALNFSLWWYFSQQSSSIGNKIGRGGWDVGLVCDCIVYKCSISFDLCILISFFILYDLINLYPCIFS